MPSYASATFENRAVYIDVNDASFILQIRLSLPSLMLYLYLLISILFLYHSNMLHTYLFITLDFYLIFLARVPGNLHPAEEVGMWTIREQKINASTAV